MNAAILVQHPHVRIDPHVFGGSPYVRGTRVLVRRLYTFYRDGTSVDAISRRYPQVPLPALFDALAFALDNHLVMEDDIEREKQAFKQLERRSA